MVNARCWGSVRDSNHWRPAQRTWSQPWKLEFTNGGTGIEGEREVCVKPFSVQAKVRQRALQTHGELIQCPGGGKNGVDAHPQRGDRHWKSLNPDKVFPVDRARIDAIGRPNGAEPPVVAEHGVFRPVSLVAEPFGDLQGRRLLRRPARKNIVMHDPSDRHHPDGHDDQTGGFGKQIAFPKRKA